MSTLLIVSSLSTSEIRKAQNPAELMKIEKAPFFTKMEKAGLITDVALVALASVPILLIILSKNGINLGGLSRIGSLNFQAVCALIAGGVVIGVTDAATIITKRNMLLDIDFLLKKLGNSKELTPRSGDINKAAAAEEKVKEVPQNNENVENQDVPQVPVPENKIQEGDVAEMKGQEGNVPENKVEGETTIPVVDGNNNF